MQTLSIRCSLPIWCTRWTVCQFDCDSFVKTHYSHVSGVIFSLCAVGMSQYFPLLWHYRKRQTHSIRSSQPTGCTRWYVCLFDCDSLVDTLYSHVSGKLLVRIFRLQRRMVRHWTESMKLYKEPVTCILCWWAISMSICARVIDPFAMLK
jgi:hypothetical protein